MITCTFSKNGINAVLTIEDNTFSVTGDENRVVECESTYEAITLLKNTLRSLDHKASK